MVTRFECEVRFMIPDIKEFEKKLKQLDAEIIYDYEFTDSYYVPDLKKPWDLRKQSLRLREWKKPEKKCEVLFTKLELIDINGMKFKRSSLKEGKLCLYKGSLEDCRETLASLGFKEWFTIEKKNCVFYNLAKHNFKTIQEFIPNLGWSGELEVDGNDPKEAAELLQKQIGILGFKKNQITSDPTSMIYAKKLGLVKT